MTVHDSILDLDTPTGPMRTYVYTPVPANGRDEPVPGLVLYSEIFQQHRRVDVGPHRAGRSVQVQNRVLHVHGNSLRIGFRVRHRRIQNWRSKA